MEYKFDTISTKSISANNLTEKFATVNYGSEVYYVSKEIFEQNPEDDEENFRYRFVIVVRDYGEYGDDCNYFGAYLYLVPISKYIGDKLEKCGYDNEDIESVQYMADAVSEGYGIVFLKDENITYNPDDEKSYADAKIKAQQYAVIGASAYEALNSIRGFYLDKPQNRIGTDGWDMLGEWVYDKGDFIKLTLARWDKN